jgi:preprotein translocase subunit SecF
MPYPEPKKSWYKSWSKMTTGLIAAPSVIAGGAWIYNACVNHGLALAGKTEMEQRLSDSTALGNQHTAEIAELRSSVQGINSGLQLIDQKTTELIDGQKKQSEQTDKILWYLIDARKQSGQASGDPPNAVFEAQERP